MRTTGSGRSSRRSGWASETSAGGEFVWISGTREMSYWTKSVNTFTIHILARLYAIKNLQINAKTFLKVSKDNVL